MAKHRSSNEPRKSQPEPQSTLAAFILAVWHGDITIYNPRTGAAWQFDTFREAQDVIYSDDYTLSPPDQ